MENKMTLKNMTRLVEAYDCFEDIIAGLNTFCDVDEYSGKLQGKYAVLEVIKEYSVLDDTDRESDPYTPFRVTLENDHISAKDRAKLILGIDQE